MVEDSKNRMVNNGKLFKGGSYKIGRRHRIEVKGKLNQPSGLIRHTSD